VLCTTHDECAQAAGALRAVGVAAFVRGSEYEQTPVTLLVEALAAWAVLGHEASGHRLGDLLRRWRDALTNRWNMAASSQLAGLLTAYRSRVTVPASQFLTDVLAAGLQDAINIPGRSDEANAVADMAMALTVGSLASCSVVDLA